ncbi:hypothetical protein WA026_017786 [Henosepilachna vigintioctopunctata]|uniref:Carboxypeptidase n=1 Tax=Henosepilachna vigintioctopunctata TaxID=420089 RepID=A0AAW1U4I9_9CUCU
MNVAFVCSIVILCFSLVSCKLGRTHSVPYVPLQEGESPGEPLILTPYINDDRIDEARRLSEVPKELFLGVESYSGYFTVDEEHDSNSFFWFIPSTDTDYRKAPLLLWLQGGPGWPSIYATFTENGPFEVMKDSNELKRRDISWTSTHSLIYIDNPVGTGFSFTNGRWCTNEKEIGEDLYKALIQFFQLFPELQHNDFFITGESYAGKYIPAIAYTIHQKNPQADIKINLKGLAIGNGLSDTINQLNYGDFLYQVGLIDANVQKNMREVEDRVAELIRIEKYEEAFFLYDSLVIGDYVQTIVKNATGFRNFYNILQPEKVDNSQYSAFVQQGHIRKALHVGNVSFATDKEVAPSLNEDFMQSVAPWISELLSHYKVLIYNGQLDIIIAYPLTLNYLKHLNFDAAEEYKTAQRHEWIVNGEIAGYVKTAGHLTEVLVRNAGHVVPADQPEWAYDLISKFVRDIPLY